MRELSDQEIKDLYESEYRREAPALWNRIEERISREETNTGEETLQFAKLGKKRWITMIASIAACFLIVGAYVLQEGNLSYQETDSVAVGELSDGEKAEEMPEADDFDEVNDVAATETDCVVETEALVLPAEDSFLNVNGILYVYDAAKTAAVQETETMELLGEVSAADDSTYPEIHLTVTNMDISGKAYLSDEGDVCIVDEKTGAVYVYVKY